MPYLETVQELLEAKEGEHVQFKEAKNRFDFGDAAKCCCALANNGGGKSWCLASRTRGPAAWSEAQPLTSRSVPVWV